MKNEKLISNFLVGFMIFLVLLSITLSFIRFVVLKDYYVFAKISCNIETEICFIEECDPSDPRCEESGFNIYKVIYKKAHSIPPLERCEENDSFCEILECSSENIEYISLEASCSS